MHPVLYFEILFPVATSLICNHNTVSLTDSPTVSCVLLLIYLVDYMSGVNAVMMLHLVSPKLWEPYNDACRCHESGVAVLATGVNFYSEHLMIC